MSEIRSQATPARDELERSAIGWQQLTDLNQPVRVWDAGHGAQCTTDRLTFPATVLFTPGDAGSGGV